METRTYNVYPFDELPKEAQQKALDNWRDNDDMPFLEDLMNERLHELLKENKITLDKNEIGTEHGKRDWNNFSEKYRCFFSLTYSQGDGVMIEMQGTWNGYHVTVKHSGHYYHSNSRTIEMYPLNGDSDEVPEKDELAFATLYEKMCDELEKSGYEEIEYQRSEEYIVEQFEANEYLFTLDGKID